MSVVLMSKRELNRIDVLARLESGRLTPGAAAALLQVSERQVYRLRRRFQDGGPAAIADRRRGRPSNNRLPDVCGWRASATVKPPMRFCRAFLRATIASSPERPPRLWISI